MLRYMYSDQGLPARYDMAKPIAELARVAEALRLGRSDDTSAVDVDEVLPETLSQILFEQPVFQQQATSEPAVASVRTGSSMWGWVILGSGFILLVGGVAWRVSLVGRRAAEIRRV